ncbi:hypothetical protein AAF712_007083 [Marasmius tenuissimus]|uniref:Uncharacterized protein n=1 Tax=Marasmius tenuissimus TaxID=585030 RepID=A0ABR2ZXZ9_9AGAR
MPTYTILRTDDDRTLALLELGRVPTVEIRGIVPKQPVSQFLRWSSDGSFHIMRLGGADYIWVPDKNDGYSVSLLNE